MAVRQYGDEAPPRPGGNPFPLPRGGASMPGSGGINQISVRDTAQKKASAALEAARKADLKRQRDALKRWGDALDREDQRKRPTAQQQRDAMREPENLDINISMLDFLDKARELLGGGGAHAAFDAREKMLRDNASFADEALNNIYANLVASIRDQQGGIDERYNQGIGNIGNYGASAVQSMQDARAASAAQRSALLERLGIADAELSAIAQGDHATQDALAQTDAVAARTQAAQNLLESNRASASDFNTATANASETRGANERALLQHSLQQALASLGMERQQYSDSMSSQALNIAAQLANEARQNAIGNRDFGYRAEQDAFERALKLGQLGGGASPEYDWSGRGDALGAAAFVLQRDGVPPQMAEQIMSAIAMEMLEHPGHNETNLIKNLRRKYPDIVSAAPEAALFNAIQTAMARR